MAEPSQKLPENVSGAWYVDDTCTPCRVCLDVPDAEQVFKYNDDESYVYVHTQPVTAEQLAAAEEALAICPQAAIGNDGG